MRINKEQLLNEVLSEAQAYCDANNESYNYRCWCGGGERGELSCKHCNIGIKAWENFEREIRRSFTEFNTD